MQIQKFLITSALYLSLASGAGVAMADERSAGGKAPTTPAAEDKVYTAGNDQLRFSLRERGVLDGYRTSRARSEGDGGPDEGERERRDGHKDGKHRKDHQADGKQKPLPPGLRKKVERGGELPPGWQKKLARGEVLSDDVYRVGRPLPPDVRRQLPVDPKGTVTLDIDGEIVRVIRDTREIVDILRR